jgi:hypothetical protein
MGVWGLRPQRVEGGVAKGSGWPASTGWNGYGGGALAFLYFFNSLPGDLQIVRFDRASPRIAGSNISWLRLACARPEGGVH